MFGRSQVLGFAGGKPVSLENLLLWTGERMCQQSSPGAEDLLDNHEGDSPKVLEQTKGINQLPHEDGLVLLLGQSWERLEEIGSS